MDFVYSDGGRAAEGFKGKAGDCVVRAIAIATEQRYVAVYEALSEGCRTQRKTKRSKAKGSARNGVNVKRKWFRDYMAAIGWTWTPTMGIGTGCRVHLADGELPIGRLIVSVSKHYTTVIDGVIHDTYDPQRPVLDLYGYPPVLDADGSLRNPVIGTTGGRCVYGYWSESDIALALAFR
tara:strand:- start:1795 stop:2331 length:537 start_codon:yes stop_codon:yes gene_type:complete